MLLISLFCISDNEYFLHCQSEELVEQVRFISADSRSLGVLYHDEIRHTGKAEYGIIPQNHNSGESLFVIK